MQLRPSFRQQAARAFTLVELLIVIFTIGVLVGLLLPAVQAARKTSRRMHCQNNLKQIGPAFHSYHNALRYFPSGGWAWFELPTYVNGHPAIGANQKAGWGFQILPYMEAVNTWQGGSATSDRDRILVAIGITNPVFFCPSRRSPQAGGSIGVHHTIHAESATTPIAGKSYKDLKKLGAGT